MRGSLRKLRRPSLSLRPRIAGDADPSSGRWPPSPARGEGNQREFDEWAGEGCPPAAITRFGEIGADKLFLETNSRLVPAIRLYETSGFEHSSNPAGDSHYQRADVYMVWTGTISWRAADSKPPPA